MHASVEVIKVIPIVVVEKAILTVAIQIEAVTIEAAFPMVCFVVSSIHKIKLK